MTSKIVGLARAGSRLYPFLLMLAKIDKVGTMSHDIECVLPLFRRDEGDYEFLGSGVLVDADHVLTCEHVIRPKNSTAREQSLCVSKEDLGLIDCVIGADIDLDLVLLHLKHRVNSKPAIFAQSPDGDQLQDVLKQLEYCGFRVVGGKLKKSRAFTSGVPLRIHDEESQLLQDLQSHGGLPEGFSGALAVVPMSGGWCGIGLAHLGGTRAATSRTMPTPVLADYCRKHNVFLKIHTPLSDLQTALEETVRRRIPENIDIRQWLKSSIPEDPNLEPFSDLAASKSAYLLVSLTSEVIRLKSQPKLIPQDGPDRAILDLKRQSEFPVSVHLYAGLYKKGTRYRVTVSATPLQVEFTALDSGDVAVRSLLLSIVEDKARSNGV
jgi:hypothetical protein